MRLRLRLLSTGVLAGLAAAQSPQSVPVPADRFELVTGLGAAIAAPIDATQALPLLNKAKRPMRLHSPVTPPHTITAVFTATGDPANTGVGELTETWAAVGQWTWTAKLGAFSVTRYGFPGETFEDRRTPTVPMRIHMLRNDVFWAGVGVAADAHVRSAPVEFNGHPATCLLISKPSTTPDPLGRRWDEEEYCLDNQTSLLQILSPAPGQYTVYSYSKGASFHGQPMPDHITTYVAGVAVLDATFRIDDATAGQAPATPTAAMIANGTPSTLADPAYTTFGIPSDSFSTVPTPVVVNAQVDSTGAVTASEVCAAADPSLAAKALAFVKRTTFGRSDAQRQYYVLVNFLPAIPKGAAPIATADRNGPKIPLTPYTVERIATDPKFQSELHEVLARRSDGAIAELRANNSDPVRNRSRHLQFPDGSSVTLYDDVKAKVTWPRLDGFQLTFFRSRLTEGPADCVGNSSRKLLRHEQINGVDVDVIQTAAGSTRLTLALAPTLGCQALHVVAEAVKANGNLDLASETKLTRLTLAEPDPSLFDVPADYAEMKPSDARRKLVESSDLGPMSPDEKAAFIRQYLRGSEQEDARYAAKK